METILDPTASEAAASATIMSGVGMVVAMAVITAAAAAADMGIAVPVAAVLVAACECRFSRAPPSESSRLLLVLYWSDLQWHISFAETIIWCRPRCR